MYKTNIFAETMVLFDNSNIELFQMHIRRFRHDRFISRDKTYIPMLFFLDNGLNYIELRKYNGQNFDVDIFISYL